LIIDKTLIRSHRYHEFNNRTNPTTTRRQAPSKIKSPNKLLEELQRKERLKAQSRAQWGGSLDKQQIRILNTIGIAELSSGEIAHEMGLKSKSGSFKESLSDLIKQGKIEYTMPENPKSRLQKYRLKSRHP